MFSFVSVVIDVFLCLKRFLLSSAANLQKKQYACYKCFGNNEECSMAAMHSDIEKYTVKCSRNYGCLTLINDHDKRLLIEKRCSAVSACRKIKIQCDESLRSRGGRRKTKLCDASCCEGYMCNLGPRFSPVYFVIAVGLLGFVALT